MISYESIYRFIYAQMARTTDYRWRHYLPRGKSKRGFRGRKGGSSASFIEGRVSLAERPPDAADRRTPGHWEADLMMFSKYGQAILTVHERKSRLLLAIRLVQQGGPRRCLPPRQAVRRHARTTAPDRHLRQRHRVRSPSAHCISSRSEPSSAIPTPLGKRAASRMPSAGCAASCPVRPTWQRYPTAAFAGSWQLTTTPRANALTSRHPPRPSPKCCTSNVNPPPRFREDDIEFSGTTSRVT